MCDICGPRHLLWCVGDCIVHRGEGILHKKPSGTSPCATTEDHNVSSMYVYTAARLAHLRCFVFSNNRCANLQKLRSRRHPYQMELSKRGERPPRERSGLTHSCLGRLHNVVLNEDARPFDCHRLRDGWLRPILASLRPLPKVQHGAVARRSNRECVSTFLFI